MLTKKKVGVAVLISDKVKFRAKKIIRGSLEYYIMVRVNTPRDHNILNGYAPKNRADRTKRRNR